MRAQCSVSRRTVVSNWKQGEAGTMVATQQQRMQGSARHQCTTVVYGSLGLRAGPAVSAQYLHCVGVCSC
jgi:hypothetical protein